MKLNSVQKIQNLNKKYELLKKSNPNKDFNYEYLQEAEEIKNNFIENLIKHFNLTATKTVYNELLDNSFSIDIKIIGLVGAVDNTIIYNIKDISQALYLVRQLNKVEINATLFYNKNNYTKHEYFYCKGSYNDSVNHILTTWNIREENNMNKLTYINKKEKNVKMNTKINYNLVMDLLRSQGQKQIELYNFISNTMYQSFKISISDSHDIILELEKMGMIEIKKSYSGNSYDNYDRKIKQYDYMIVINE